MTATMVKSTIVKSHQKTPSKGPATGWPAVLAPDSTSDAGFMSPTAVPSLSSVGITVADVSSVTAAEQSLQPPRSLSGLSAVSAGQAQVILVSKVAHKRTQACDRK